MDCIDECVPMGRASVVQAGTNWAGWRDLVPHLGFRTLWLWEEFFTGVKKSTESAERKLGLEDLIRMLSPLSDKGGDIRASKDSEISHPTKVTLISGLQYSALAEYLAGDTKGALERLTFYLSSISKAKDTKQSARSLAALN